MTTKITREQVLEMADWIREKNGDAGAYADAMFMLRGLAEQMKDGETKLANAAPGMTDLMVPPETITEEYLQANPLPEPWPTKAAVNRALATWNTAYRGSEEVAMRAALEAALTQENTNV